MLLNTYKYFYYELFNFREILKQKLKNPEIESRSQLFEIIRYEEHQEVQSKNSSSVKAKHVITWD